VLIDETNYQVISRQLNLLKDRY